MSDGPDKEKGVIKSKQMVSQPTSRQPDPETVPDLDYEPTRDELTEEMDRLEDRDRISRVKAKGAVQPCLNIHLHQVKLWC